MPKPSFWPSLVLTLLGSVALGLATNVASGELPGWFGPYKWTAWLLVPLLALVHAVVAWRIERRRALSPERARALLIAEQRRWWITEVLEKSLHHEARVSLSARVSVTEEHPWKLRVDGRAEVTRRGVTEIVDAMNGWALILGAPGSGKTTMLLELLRDLLTRAERGGPVPLLLNLATWEGRLEDWAAREAARRYRAQGPVGEWLSDGTLILLLDGLDEVAADRRDDCLTAINAFGKANPGTAVVVCCRSEEYAEADGELALRGRVEIEPLTEREVDAYLRRRKLTHARSVLASDAELRGLVTSPLLLSVLTLAYRDTRPGEIAGDALTRLFDAYLERMLEQRPHAGLPPERLLPQLRFLARRMRDADRTLFGFDDIDATWPLSAPVSRWRLAALPVIPVLAGLGWWWQGWWGALIGAACGALFQLPNPLWVDSERARAMPERPETTRFTHDMSRLATLAVAYPLGAAVGVPMGLEHGVWAGLGFGFTGAAAPVFASILIGRTPLIPLRPRPSELPGPQLRGYLRAVRIPTYLSGVAMGLGTLLYTVWWVDLEISFASAVMCAVGLTAYLHLGNIQYALSEQRAVRRALDRDGLLALPAAPWLDHARDCLILRKVGRDYMFVHLLLRDHLARSA